MSNLEKEMPMVSIIMPAHNASQYIAESIESAMNQTYSNFELLIIDDLSSDNTYQIASEYAKKDTRIKVFHNKENMGVAKTRNYAIKQAAGEYIAFLDSDDIWLEEKLEKQVNLAKEKNIDLVYTSYALINELGNEAYPRFIVPADVDMNCMLKKNVIGCSTVMIRAKIAKEFLFHTDFYHEDYVLWMECLQAGYIVKGLTEVLTRYRVYATSKAGNKKKSAMYRYQIYRRYLKFSIIKSHILIIQYAINGFLKYKKK